MDFEVDFGELLDRKFDKKTIDFSIDFCMDFWWFLDWILGAKRHQKSIDFLVDFWMIFGKGFGPPSEARPGLWGEGRGPRRGVGER